MPFDPVVAQLLRLYGVTELPRATGVLHVAAVWDGPDGWTVMKIGEDSPNSSDDLFALGLGRARADVIITTGQILRDEPALVYDLPGALGADLARWRRQVQGRTEPPTVVVLTGSGDVDPSHPTLRSWAKAVVLTGASGAERARAAGVDVPIHVEDGLTPRSAVAWAQAQLGARTVTIEAGPQTAAALYEAPAVVDELMLSVYCEQTLPPHVVGRPFVAPRAQALALTQLHPPKPVLEASGAWRFVRFSREQTDRAGRPFDRTGDEGKARDS